MDKDISRYLVERLSHRLGRLFVMKFIDPNHEFDGLYHDFRVYEDRIYKEDEVMEFPQYQGKNKRLAKEWKGRKHSTDLLLNYLTEKGKGEKMNILDLGCGIGWLSNRLSDLPNSRVYGLDIIQEELMQAAKVFDKPNLQFVYGNFYRDILPKSSFDVVVLSACIEFFPNLETLFNNISKVLKKDGEIHIVNSPFYHKEVLEKEEQKSIEYFEKAGFSAMKRHFFHHTFEDIENYHGEEMYAPESPNLFSRMLGGSSKTPFFWYRIKKADLVG